jgi:hypothetical protein
MYFGRVGEAEAKSRKRHDAETRNPEIIPTFVRTGFRMTEEEVRQGKFRMTKREEEKL